MFYSIYFDVQLYMSRQYLKQLQQRAQKLLKESSEEEYEEDVNAYTATRRDTKSTNKHLDQFLHYDTESESDDPQHNHHQIADVQLLKRLVSIQNQNNSLKNMINQQTKQIYNLKSDILEYKKAIQQLKTQLVDREYAGQDKLEKSVKRQSRQEEYLQKIFQEIQRHENSLHEKEVSLTQKENYLRQRQQEINRQDINFNSPQYSNNPNRKKQGGKHGEKATTFHKDMHVFNQYTIKNIKQSQNIEYEELGNKIVKLEKIVAQMQKYNGKMEKRLGQVDNKKNQLEALMIEQKKKSQTLVNFINKEIPHMNSIIVELTAKLDARVERIMLSKGSL